MRLRILDTLEHFVAHHTLVVLYAFAVALLILGVELAVPAPTMHPTQESVVPPAVSAPAPAAPITRTRTRPRVQRADVSTRPTSPILCLAQNLYFEARNEPFAALEAVAATVFNRMELPHYPSTVCGVIYQHRQYSWTLEYSRWSVKPPLKFVEMSKQFLDNRDDIQTAYPVTHFHHVGISPKWAPRMTVVSKIGAHIFYRM